MMNPLSSLSEQIQNEAQRFDMDTDKASDVELKAKTPLVHSVTFTMISFSQVTLFRLSLLYLQETVCYHFHRCFVSKLFIFRFSSSLRFYDQHVSPSFSNLSSHISVNVIRRVAAAATIAAPDVARFHFPHEKGFSCL